VDVPSLKTKRRRKTPFPQIADFLDLLLPVYQVVQTGFLAPVGTSPYGRSQNKVSLMP